MVADTNEYFSFEDDFSKKGTILKYIDFFDPDFRLSSEQKRNLKAICRGYFFYSKIKHKWGFTHRGDNEVNVYNYLLLGILPENILQEQISSLVKIRREPLPFNIQNFVITFVELKGRPLFYDTMKNGIIEISINLEHWFFSEKSDAEKAFAKKVVLSLVGTQYEFTSQVIDKYITKLHIIQANLKENYEKYK